MSELRSTARDSQPEEAMDAAAQAIHSFENEDYDEAVKLAERAKHLASRSGLVRELLGLSLYRQERWQEAARELLTFKRLTNSFDQNHVIADCYRALGRPERALEICNEVQRTKVSPDTWAELCIVAAGAHADRGEIDKALHRLSLADLKPRSLEPYHLKLWYVQADLLEKAGKFAEATEIWQAIAAEDPDFFDVSERIG